MKGTNHWTLLMFGVLAMAALVVQACLVTDGNGQSGPHHCETECYEYWDCDNYCDSYGCYEDCGYRETCDTYCGSESPFPDESELFDEPAVCYSGIECRQGRVCVNNRCQAADTEERGGAGLCQTCESRSDCVEAGALCLGLNYSESSGPTETICGRACTTGQDCPVGFECLDVGEDNDQCVPDADGNDVRTCSASSDLECVAASDCATGERCVDNHCRPPADAECTGNGECSDGERCHVFQCVDDPDGAECIAGPDCAAGEFCVDGQCVGEAQSCVFNSECSADQRCVEGECVNTCQESADCTGNQWCRQGICEYIECYQSADCAAGNICVDASCRKACGANGDCAFGYRCASLGFCEADPAVECRSSAECGSDQVCTEGSCVTPCDCNQQCAQGQVCDEAVGQCEDADSGGEPLTCADDCECPSGLSCNEGTCG